MMDVVKIMRLRMRNLRMFCRWRSQSGENWCRSISHKVTLSLHHNPGQDASPLSSSSSSSVFNKNIPWISYEADVTDLNFKGWCLYHLLASYFQFRSKKRYLRKVSIVEGGGGGSVRQIMIVSTQLISVVGANLWYPRIAQPALMGLGITMALQTRKENMVFTFSSFGKSFLRMIFNKKFLDI